MAPRSARRVGFEQAPRRRRRRARLGAANPAGREDDGARLVPRPRARSGRSGTRGRRARRPRDARARNGGAKARAAPAGRSGRPGAGRVVVPAAVTTPTRRDAGSARMLVSRRRRSPRARGSPADASGARGCRTRWSRARAEPPTRHACGRGPRPKAPATPVPFEAPRTARLGRRGKGLAEGSEAPRGRLTFRFALRSTRFACGGGGDGRAEAREIG